MNKKKTNLVFFINISLLVLYFLTITFFSIRDNALGMDLNKDSLVPFNEGWTIKINDDEIKNAKLPQNFHLEPNSNVSIEREINPDDFIYPTLKIRSSMMDVKAYIDNQLFYSFDVTTKYKNILLPYPASWQLIEIPINESNGKTLKITFSSPIVHFSGLINSIILGNGEAIIINLIKDNLLNLIISISIIMLSIFALSSLFWIKKIEINKQILYLSSFGISAGLWILSESTLLQLITSNRFLISSTSYIMNLLIPLIILLFFRDIILLGFRKLISFIATLDILLLILEFILQITGIVPFMASTIFSIIMIIISSIVILFCLVYEGNKKNNKKAKRYLYIFLALFVFVSIIIGLFIAGIYFNLEKYLSLGVFSFFLLVMSDVIKSINRLIETKNKSLFYKQLAYEDYLTKGWNRTSFESDVDKLISIRKEFRLVLLDLNHLKVINDSFGHKEGDFALIEVYKTIKNIINEDGKCYRISGDEFACIIYKTNEKLFEKYSILLNQSLKEKSKEKPYEIVLAFGSKVYKNNQNFADFYIEVDKEMYEHKKKIKEII